MPLLTQDLQTQYREHSAHPPRVRCEGALFVVDVYSPERGYLPMAEWRTQGEADKDLESWETAWNDEQERFRALLGLPHPKTYRDEAEMKAEMKRLLAEEAALFYAPPKDP